MATLHLDPLPRNATPGELLRFLADTAEIDGKLVGKLTFLANGATAEIDDRQAAKVVAATDGATFRDRRVRVRFAEAPGRRENDADHFFALIDLLALEAEEESFRLKEQAKGDRSAGDPFGTSLSSLLIAEESYGLGGRLILEFGRKASSDPLPPNRLQPGSPVALTQQAANRQTSRRGVVVERDEKRIIVAFDETEESLPEDATWRLDLSPDEASRRRQVSALHRARLAKNERLADLREILLGESPPRFTDELPVDAELLNGPQRDAVAFALSAKDVAVIHGPPGTGKTTTVVEIIRRAIRRGDKVLACGPSNAAVDNLAEKLLAAGEEPVRIGHPARVSSAVRERALDLLVEVHPDAKQARKYIREATTLFREADKWSKTPPPPGEKRAKREEARDLLSEARKLEELAADRILDAAAVVCATLTGLDSETLGRRRFDLVVIDEACQSTEPASWVPVLRAEKLVLAGDPCQLPPTVLNPRASAGGLGISLMERVMQLHGPSVARLLTVQYRMHERIMAFPSAEFYAGKLVADPGVSGHRLCDLVSATPDPLTESPVTFIDTAGAGYDDELDEETNSRRNPQEAKLAAKKVRAMLALGVPATAIAIITPYSAQVRLLRELLNDDAIEIDSVDGFQGREKEAIVISFVRSNPEGEIGFLGDTRRTNVALTRARRSLLVIGDSATLAHDPFYERLLGYFEQIEAYRSVWEEAE